MKKCVPLPLTTPNDDEFTSKLLKKRRKSSSPTSNTRNIQDFQNVTMNSGENPIEIDEINSTISNSNSNN